MRWDVLTTLGQVLIVLAMAPLLTGLMRQVRALAEGRAGAGVLQPVRDLRKLFRRQAISPTGTGWAFRFAPLALMATSLAVAAAVPLTTTHPAMDPAADLFAVVGMLALGTVTLAVSALETGTAFGGMGSSREMLVLALVEPTILVSVFAMSARVGSTNLAAIVTATADDPARALTPAGMLAAIALIVVIIAETGRLPVDNPSTHLELTMIHEAMVLEYSGVDLALVELASSVRLTVLLGMFAALFFPVGIATTAAAWPIGILAFAIKVAALGAGLAAAEVAIAKLRLFRIPELLAGSFVIALLAVVTSFLLGT